MGRINIELPEKLHEELKVMAARRDETLKDTVISVLADEADIDVTEATQ